LRAFGLVQFPHQARFSARGIVLFNYAFFCCPVERAYGLAGGLFGFFEVPRREQLIGVLDFGARPHADNSVARAMADALPLCL